MLRNCSALLPSGISSLLRIGLQFSDWNLVKIGAAEESKPPQPEGGLRGRRRGRLGRRGRDGSRVLGVKRSSAPD